MKVRRNTLLLIAALVWSAAGFNILRIGLLAYPPYRTVVNYLLSALVFTVFQVFIFGQLVNKHTARISAYEEELHFFLKFFDVKSFIIMAVMMTGGIWLRSSGVAPDRFISLLLASYRDFSGEAWPCFWFLKCASCWRDCCSPATSPRRPSPPRARRNIRNTARMEQFWDHRLKTALFCGQDGSIAVKQRSVRTKRRFLYAVLAQIPLDSPSTGMV